MSKGSLAWAYSGGGGKGGSCPHPFKKEKKENKGGREMEKKLKKGEKRVKSKNWLSPSLIHKFFYNLGEGVIIFAPPPNLISECAPALWVVENTHKHKLWSDHKEWARTTKKFLLFCCV